jgi:hypothetical protein
LRNLKLFLQPDSINDSANLKPQFSHTAHLAIPSAVHVSSYISLLLPQRGHSSPCTSSEFVALFIRSLRYSLAICSPLSPQLPSIHIRPLASTKSS